MSTCKFNKINPQEKQDQKSSDAKKGLHHQTVFRQGRTLLDQGCPNFDKNFFGASVHEKIEI